MIVCVILWFLIVCQDFFFFVSSELSCNMIVILFGSVWKSFDGKWGSCRWSDSVFKSLICGVIWISWE